MVFLLAFVVVFDCLLFSFLLIVVLICIYGVFARLSSSFCGVSLPTETLFYVFLQGITVALGTIVCIWHGSVVLIGLLARYKILIVC